MKYNDKSNKFAEWTTKKLKNEAKGYYETIYKIGCYGISDLRMLDEVIDELKGRGITPKEYELSF